MNDEYKTNFSFISTIRKADRIVVMDKGRVVQVGDTQELLKTKGGAFGELIKRQRVESREW